MYLLNLILTGHNYSNYLNLKNENSLVLEDVNLNITIVFTLYSMNLKENNHLSYLRKKKRYL